MVELIVESVGKIRIGVSACLLGKTVRYDGGQKLDPYITGTLGQYLEYVPVCPEVEYGLPVPREPLHLVGDPASPRLLTVRTGVDHTEGMTAWARRRLDQLEGEGLCGFIFKSRSPSSGLRGVPVYGPSGTPSHNGVGIFAAAFTRRYPLIPVTDDGRLHDPGLRETFVDSVLVYRRWQEFVTKGGAPKDLIAFHTELKYLILAHSPKHYRMLGRLVARAGTEDAEELRALYVSTLMEAVHHRATVSRNTNVLLHSVGYFKRRLTNSGKEELLEAIRAYHRGYVPLIVPITLINHYVLHYGQPYLERQAYFNPDPIELLLKNHA